MQSGRSLTEQQAPVILTGCMPLCRAFTDSTSVVPICSRDDSLTLPFSPCRYQGTGALCEDSLLREPLRGLSAPYQDRPRATAPVLLPASTKAADNLTNQLARPAAPYRRPVQPAALTRRLSSTVVQSEGPPCFSCMAAPALAPGPDGHQEGESMPK